MWVGLKKSGRRSRGVIGRVRERLDRHFTVKKK